MCAPHAPEQGGSKQGQTRPATQGMRNASMVDKIGDGPAEFKETIEIG
jgi:hypothetical protein